MKIRHLTIGGVPTSADGWTLCEWKLSDPAYRKNFLTIPGLDGDLDLSDVLNDRAVYSSRTLTARLELSEGTRQSRDAIISRIVNQYDGTTQQIMLPDDRYHYLSGRISVAVQYSTQAHACIKLTAICDPWRYCTDRITLLLDSPNGIDGQSDEPNYTETVINNSGRMPVSPLLRAYGGDIILSADGFYQFTLTEGSQRTIPDIILRSGENTLMHCGNGTDAQLRVIWREAIL